MQLQCRAIDYYSLILVGHGPTLFIFGGAMAYTAYTVPTPMVTREATKVIVYRLCGHVQKSSCGTAQVLFTRKHTLSQRKYKGT